PSTGPQGLILLGALTGSQDQSNPSGMYGHCGNVNSGIARKSQVPTPFTNLTQVAGIKVLDCHGVDGPGGSSVVPCPGGTNPVPTYCVLVQNDGLGNHVLVGVFIDKSLPCVLAGKTSGPPARITISFTDNAYGITGVELRGGASNATTQFFAGSSNNV